MLKGSSVFKGEASPHINELYDGWMQDMITCGIFGIEILHTCIWRRDGKTPLEEAKRLASYGLAVMEDSGRGPMLTRTYRGSYAIRKSQ